jgi:hypothetical protein
MIIPCSFERLYDARVREDPKDVARRQYADALDALRRARARFVEERVPMEVDGQPPAWTHTQHAAVITYAVAWDRFVRAHQAVAETGATRQPQPSSDR